MTLVQQTVEDGGREDGIAEDLTPLADGPTMTEDAPAPMVRKVR